MGVGRAMGNETIYLDGLFRFLLRLLVDTLCTAVTPAESRPVIWKVPAQTVKEWIQPPWDVPIMQFISMVRKWTGTKALWFPICSCPVSVACPIIRTSGNTYRANSGERRFIVPLHSRRVRSFFGGGGGGVHFKLERTSCQQSLIIIRKVYPFLLRKETSLCTKYVILYWVLPIWNSKLGGSTSELVRQKWYRAPKARVR